MMVVMPIQSGIGIGESGFGIDKTCSIRKDLTTLACRNTNGIDFAPPTVPLGTRSYHHAS